MAGGVRRRRPPRSPLAVGAECSPCQDQECHNHSPEGTLDAALATHVFHRALLVSDQEALRSLVAELRAHEPPELLVERALVPAMAKLGAEWAQGLLPAEVVASAARTAEFVAGLLVPPPARRGGAGRVAVGSLDPAHTLGKRLVEANLAAAGYEVVDLGMDLGPAAALEGMRACDARVLLLSASMVRCALRASAVAEAIHGAGDGLKVGVGGAPFRLDETLWRAVGADGSAAAAHEAPALAARLLATAI